jgi:hypothetical protein
MSNFTLILKTVLFFILVLTGGIATAQVRVYGTVYDRSGRFGMPYVSVISSGGGGTVTDSIGRYSLNMAPADSLSFSYQGKATMKIPVAEIPRNRPFDTKIHVDVTTLPTVVVEEKRRTYQMDSIANRMEYQKVFNFNPEYISTGSTVVGFNLDALLSMRKIKRMERFRDHLIDLEQENYVNHRFNKALVKKLTGISDSTALEAFMQRYRPSYYQILEYDTEYDYFRYIKDLGRYFRYDWKREHPESK